MPPKKTINKGRDAVTPSIKKPKTKQVKNNTFSGKNLQISIKNNINTTRKESQVESQNKTKQENVQLSKRDINIILANEVLKTQFPKRKSILETFELNHTEQIDLSKKGKRNKTLPAKQNLVVKKRVSKKMLNNPVVSDQTKTQKRKVTRKRKADNQETESSNIALEADNSEILKKTHVKINRSKKSEQKQKKIKDKETKAVKTVSRKKLPAKPVIDKNSARQVGGNVQNSDEIMTVKVDVPGYNGAAPQILKENKNITNNSRRASSCSELSWTKDISSCSTTSCVTVSSNDFIRIDNKLPILKLTKVNCLTKNTPILVSESNKSLNNEVSSEISPQLDERTSIHVSLNLSSSSSSSSSCSSSSSAISRSKNSLCFRKMKTADYLSKLSSHLKLFDLECIEWIGYKDNSNNWNEFNMEDFTENSIHKSNVLKEEKALLQHCETIERLLCKYTKANSSFIISDNTGKEKRHPLPLSSPNESENQTTDKNQVMKVVNSTEKSQNGAEHFTMANNFIKLNVNHSSSKCVEENDDDDALSLYAESITGLDISRKNNSKPSVSDSHNIEEYVPKMVTKSLITPEKITYQPTAIVVDKQNDCQINVVATVCEKQKADSTSVNKEQDIEKNPSEHIIYEDRRGNIGELNANANSTNPISRIKFVTENYKPTRGIKSLVYEQACFYYIISGCKLVNCKYPHTFPKREEVQNKVSMLDEESFVTEYMLTRSMPELRRRFGLCFVAECIKRKLTRLLVEMAIDFVIRADEMVREDVALKIEVVEETLLYLNNVDLNVVNDLLRFKLYNADGVLLCDFLVKSIAESQNFTRFVPIFISLVCFMITIDRSFDIDVSSQLVERVCILPYEDKLARALIEVTKRTSDKIFYYFMVEKFENLLFSSNRDLYEAFTFLKKRKILNGMPSTNTYIPQCGNREVEKMSGAGVTQFDKDMRHSPDTTNFDNLNKSLESKLTRTIEVSNVNNQNRFVEDWAHMVCNSSSCSEDRTLNSQPGTSVPSCKRRVNRQNFKRPMNYNAYGRNNSINSQSIFSRTIPSSNGIFKRPYTALPSTSSSGSDRGQMNPRLRNSPHSSRGLLNRGGFNRRMEQNAMRRSGQNFF